MLPLNPEAFEKMTNEELFDYCKTEMNEAFKNDGLSRQAKRKYQRDFNDMERAIKSFTPHQMQVVKALVKIQVFHETQEVSEKATNVMEDTVKAALVILGASNEQLQFFIDTMHDILRDESEISFEFKKKYGSEKMASKRLEEIMVQAETMAKELIEKGVKQNEIIEILISKINLLSKSKAAKIVSNIKAQKKAENKDIEVIENDAAVEEITKVIFQEDKEVVNGVKPNSEVVVQVESKEEVKEERAVVKKSNLKIKSVVVEGDNGIYTKEGDSVTLKRKELSLQFNSKEEVMNFVAEIYEVYGM